MHDELELRLTPGPEQTYNVEVTAASGARAFGHFTPPAAVEVERFRRSADPGSRRVRGISPSEDLARTFGGRLFEALLATPGTREVYAGAVDAARQQNRGLRVTVSLRAAPDLAGIPWEFLYDQPRFLALHKDSPIVRYVDLEDPPSPLQVAGPLRILGMISRPVDHALAVLDAEGEQAALQQRLDPLIRAGRVSLKWLDRATLAALQQEVDHGEDFHVFHYIGHGTHDPDTGASHLILERPDRRPHWVTGQQLGTYLGEESSLRLVVLNACEVASTDPTDPMAGVATALLEYGIPAVVAMQFAITDTGALTFADEFYRGIAGGEGVDTALTHARRALATTSDLEWGTPVLFLRAPDPNLFALSEPPAAVETPSPSPIPTAQPAGRPWVMHADTVRKEGRSLEVARQLPVPPADVVAALLEVVSRKFKLKSADHSALRWQYSSGVSLSSYGENFTAQVMPAEGGATIRISGKFKFGTEEMLSTQMPEIIRRQLDDVTAILRARP